MKSFEDEEEEKRKYSDQQMFKMSGRDEEEEKRKNSEQKMIKMSVEDEGMKRENNSRLIKSFVESKPLTQKTNLQRSTSLCEMSSRTFPSPNSSMTASFGGTEIGGFSAAMKSLGDSRESFYSEMQEVTRDCKSDSTDLKELFKDLSNEVLKCKDGSAEDRDQGEKQGFSMLQRSSSESMINRGSDSTKEYRQNKLSNNNNKKYENSSSVSSSYRSEGLSIKEQIQLTRQLAKQSQSIPQRQERNEYNHLRKAQPRAQAQPRNFARPTEIGSDGRRGGRDVGGRDVGGMTKTDEEYFKGLQEQRRHQSGIYGRSSQSPLLSPSLEISTNSAFTAAAGSSALQQHHQQQQQSNSAFINYASSSDNSSRNSSSSSSYIFD